MKKILNINERISYLIENQYNDNQKKFAESIGYSAQVIFNIVSGRKTKPSFDVLNAIISTNDDINSEWLLTGQGNILKNHQVLKPIVASNNNKGIPMLPFDAFAGVGDSSVSGVSFEGIEDLYHVPLFDGIHVDFMISVRGSSMYPKYSSGDVVACRLIDELLFVQWNKVYVIDSISQGIMMKRLKKSQQDEFMICKSDNKEYDEFEIPLTDVRKIALVVGVIRLE